MIEEMKIIFLIIKYNNKEYANSFFKIVLELDNVLY